MFKITIAQRLEEGKWNFIVVNFISLLPMCPCFLRSNLVDVNLELSSCELLLSVYYTAHNTVWYHLVVGCDKLKMYTNPTLTTKKAPQRIMLIGEPKKAMGCFKSLSLNQRNIGHSWISGHSGQACWAAGTTFITHHRICLAGGPTDVAYVTDFRKTLTFTIHHIVFLQNCEKCH